MDNLAAPSPQSLLDDLAESDADLAAGRIVLGTGLMSRLDNAIARLAMADCAGTPPSDGADVLPDPTIAR